MTFFVKWAVKLTQSVTAQLMSALIGLTVCGGVMWLHDIMVTVLGVSMKLLHVEHGDGDPFCFEGVYNEPPRLS